LELFWQDHVPLVEEAKGSSPATAACSGPAEERTPTQSRGVTLLAAGRPALCADPTEISDEQ
jgi:hypothetical protein